MENQVETIKYENQVETIKYTPEKAKIFLHKFFYFNTFTQLGY